MKNTIRKLASKLKQDLRDNPAEYYTSLALFVAVPASLGLIVGWKYGLFLSFLLQSIVGILYIKGVNK